ncbi:MAG: hypothetical protein FVQ83_14900 [Chloroflexi bacterium]|nr:hypothetical protein [Chloroflexota bacterium]
MLRKFKDIHTGEICVVIGNGPSLKDTPLELLKKYPSFGANKIFLLDGFTSTYYTVIDQYMIHSCTPRLMAWSSLRELPRRTEFSTGYAPREMFIRRGFPVPGSNQINCVVEAGFSTDINECVIMGGTVTFANLQIAYYMGFTTALLVGVDHNYSGMTDKKPGATFVAEGEDVDHFHVEYFESGHIFAAPELEGTSRSYEAARRVWETDGRKIINLTPGTKLDVFEVGTYEDWIKGE